MKLSSTYLMDCNILFHFIFLEKMTTHFVTLKKS